MALAQIRVAARDTFGIDLTVAEAECATKSLVAGNQAIESPSGSFLPTTDARSSFRKAVDEFAALEKDVAARFASAVCEQCASLVPAPTWSSFRDDCLIPLIASEGAQVIALSAQPQNGDVSTNAIISQYIETHDAGNGCGLAECLDGFLRGPDERVREYVLRQLDAHFTVVAAGLDESTIAALTGDKRDKLTLRLVLDTNFLFSILGWHDHPSNEAAISLLEMSKSAHSAIDVELLVLPTTVDETRHALALKAERLANIHWSRSLAEAALDFGVPGLLEQYLESRASSDFGITIEEYADMLSHDLETRLQDIGVMSIYEDVSGWSMHPEVLDSINDQMAFERAHRGPEDRRDYQLVKHDMVAYHWVMAQRPAGLRTAVDAGYWLVTLDYRLLGFDRYKSRGSRAAQVCLHPSTAAQLLRFWIPRDSMLERALFSGVTQPLYPAATLAETERVTYRIIERLGALDGIDDVSPEAIRDTLADRVLQGRMRDAHGRDEEIELVELAFMDLVKQREEELAKQRSENAVLERALLKSRDDLAKASEHVEGRRIQTEKLKKQVQSVQGTVGELESAVQRKNEDILARDARIEQLEHRSLTREWRDRWLLGTALILSLVGVVAFWWLSRLDLGSGLWLYGLVGALLVLVWLEVVVSSARRKDLLSDSHLLSRLASLNRLIWIGIATVLLSLVAAMLWDLIRPFVPWA